MNIVIVVHSETGNTYSVVKKLEQKLLLAGHTVNIERIETVDGTKTNEMDPTKISLKILPDISTYEGIIFAAPVRGFSISPILAAYLSHIGSLENQKIACVVTQFFPYPWMGGNRAISQMKKACESKGASVNATGIVNWKSSKREKMIFKVIDNVSSVF